MRLAKLDICNMALANIGQSDLKSLTQPGEAAAACKLRYDEARLECLSMALWNFASVWKKGVLLDVEAKPPYRAAYQYPPDALKVFEILKPGGDKKPIPFEVTARPGMNGEKLIHTSHPEPVFIYSVDREQVEDFEPTFVQAFVWLLSSKIAMRITKKLQIQQECYKMAVLKASEARSSDFNEGTEDTDKLASYHEVR